GTLAEYEYKSLGGDTGAAALKYANEVVLPTFGLLDGQGNPPQLTAATDTAGNLTFTPTTISFDPAKLADLHGSFARVTPLAPPAPASSTALTKEGTLDQALVKTFDTTDPSKLTALAMPAAALYAFAVAKLQHEVKASYDKIVSILKLGMQKIVVTKGKIAT